MPTIKDIAKNLNLSISTVSRALNNHPAISNNTKEMVKNEAKRINYIQNALAQSLSNNKSYTITLIINIDDEQSYQNTYFYEEIQGIERYVYQKGYTLTIANIKSSIKKQNMINFLVKSKRTDGIILPSNILTSDLVDELIKLKIPFVSIGQPVGIDKVISWVDIDNFNAGETATKYLINSGHKEIAFMGLNKNKFFSQRRYDGYTYSLNYSKIKVNSNSIIESGNSKEEGYENTLKLFKQNPNISGIICADEILSFGVIKALKYLGKTIPNDVALISFDNTQIAELSYPSISTIDIDVLELGYQSAKMLFDQIENNSVKSQGLLIGIDIVLRETTR